MSICANVCIRGCVNHVKQLVLYVNYWLMQSEIYLPTQFFDSTLSAARSLWTGTMSLRGDTSFLISSVRKERRRELKSNVELSRACKMSRAQLCEKVNLFPDRMHECMP